MHGRNSTHTLYIRQIILLEHPAIINESSFFSLLHFAACKFQSDPPLPHLARPGPSPSSSVPSITASQELNHWTARGTNPTRDEDYDEILSAQCPPILAYANWML